MLLEALFVKFGTHAKQLILFLEFGSQYIYICRKVWVGGGGWVGGWWVGGV